MHTEPLWLTDVKIEIEVREIAAGNVQANAMSGGKAIRTATIISRSTTTSSGMPWDLSLSYGLNRYQALYHPGKRQVNGDACPCVFFRL